MTRRLINLGCLFILSSLAIFGQSADSFKIHFELKHGALATKTSNELNGRIGNFSSVGIGLSRSFGNSDISFLTSLNNLQLLAIDEHSPLRGLGTYAAVMDNLGAVTFGLGYKRNNFLLKSVSLKARMSYGILYGVRGGSYMSYTDSDNEKYYILDRPRTPRESYFSLSSGLGYTIKSSHNQNIEIGILATYNFLDYTNQYLNIPAYMVEPFDPIPGDFMPSHHFHERFELYSEHVGLARLSRFGIQLSLIYQLPYHDLVGFPRKVFIRGEDEAKQRNFGKNLVYLDALGMGGANSINYEYLIGHKIGANINQYYSFRIGIGWFPDLHRGFLATAFITNPISLGYGVGYRDWYLAIGPYFTTQVLFGSRENPQSKIQSYTNIFGGTIGIRYMPTNKKLMGHISYTPYRLNYGTLRSPLFYPGYDHWFGIGLGFRFGK